MNGVLIAGTASGTGKTTLSLGIMAALTKRKLKVQPFKVGPDYIDPIFHEFVTQSPSYNLDGWMLKEETLKYLFYKNNQQRDIAIIEGVMGLYDGFGTERQAIGSSAHIAKILKTPVILVIDGGGLSTSAAAMAMGYQMYDPDVNIKGVIINKVSGQAHYELLKEAIERDTDIKALGYLPKDSGVSLDSRTLGLIPPEEVQNLQHKVNTLVDLIETCIDIDGILEIAENTMSLERPKNSSLSLGPMGQGLTLGIFKDQAFQFYYQDNIQLLKEMGINIRWISPLKDKELPQDIHGLYIGGGYVDVFAQALQENIQFRNTLKNALEQGLPAYGEGAGLLYLTQDIKDLEGRINEMVGFLPLHSMITERIQRFGYVEVTTSTEISTRAHEFHYSKVEEVQPLDCHFQVKKERKHRPTKYWQDGYKHKNVIAGFPYIHFYSNLDFVKEFISNCKKYQGGKKHE